MKKNFKPIFPRKLAVNRVAEGIEHELRMERMEHIGTVKIKGNVPCLTCGQGNTCEMSMVPILYGVGTKALSKLCVVVEDQEKVWEEITRLEKVLGTKLS